MRFDLQEAIEILERTPTTLRALLTGLSPSWITENEGPDSWSPFDIVGHLVFGELTDWIGRTKMILEHGEAKTFEPFDRTGFIENSKGKSLQQLLDEFERSRKSNLATLRSLEITEEDLQRKGRHPDFGPVTLGQLLSSWVVHDLGHIRQIVRVMAKQYSEDAGPWKAYLPVLSE